jgi:soluble lytic murein transglycosylase-like protein
MKYILTLLALISPITAYADSKPDAIKVIITNAAEAVGVSKELLSAICYVESRHKSNSSNINDGKDGKTSHGLCQIKYDTARFVGYRGSVKGLYDSKINALYAAKYLLYQLRRYNQDYRLAAAAYNAGSLIVTKKGKIVNYDYVEQVEDALTEGR